MGSSCLGKPSCAAFWRCCTGLIACSGWSLRKTSPCFSSLKEECMRKRRGLQLLLMHSFFFWPVKQSLEIFHCGLLRIPSMVLLLDPILNALFHHPSHHQRLSEHTEVSNDRASVLSLMFTQWFSYCLLGETAAPHSLIRSFTMWLSIVDKSPWDTALPTADIPLQWNICTGMRMVF